MAMLLGAGSALAGDTDAVVQFDPAQKPESLLQTHAQAKDCDDEEVEVMTEMIMVGGISSPQDAEWVDADALAEIPVVAADAMLNDDSATAKFGADPADANTAQR
jgi:hypothetical protein